MELMGDKFRETAVGWGWGLSAPRGRWTEGAALPSPLGLASWWEWLCPLSNWSEERAEVGQ